MEQRPPAHPLFGGPSEYSASASGSPSGLTDRERSLLLWLTIRNLMRQTGTDEQTAADALDHFGARGEVTIEGDPRDVYVKVVGHVHIHAARDWLRAMAHGHGTDPLAN